MSDCYLLWEECEDGHPLIKYPETHGAATPCPICSHMGEVKDFEKNLEVLEEELDVISNKYNSMSTVFDELQDEILPPLRTERAGLDKARIEHHNEMEALRAATEYLRAEHEHFNNLTKGGHQK